MRDIPCPETSSGIGHIVRVSKALSEPEPTEHATNRQVSIQSRLMTTSPVYAAAANIVRSEYFGSLDSEKYGFFCCNSAFFSTLGRYRPRSELCALIVTAWFLCVRRSANDSKAPAQFLPAIILGQHLASIARRHVSRCAHAPRSLRV